LRAYLLPGLAADARLFQPQIDEFPGITVPAWIEPKEGESLERYSRRMAEQLQPEAPYWIGGFSFGGMVALEMAPYLRPRPQGVLLICGVRGRHQITANFKRQATLGSLVPDNIQKVFYGPYAERFAEQEGLDEANTQLLTRMAVAVDPKFLRWASKAALDWFGELNVAGVRIVHIHGEKDTVIPDVRKQATHTIRGAGHLVTLTHSKEVNAVLATL
jgi:pimeloyl-ACP methyl ester carboxylesterase